MVSQLHDDIERDPRVRALLAAVAAPTEPGPVPGEQEALTAFRSAHSPRRFSMPSSLTPVRTAVAASLGAGVLLAAGVGGAAAGVLPGAAQDTARTWLDTVGVEVPGPDEHSAGHADQRGRSAESGHDDATHTVDTADAADADAEATDSGGATEGAAVEKELPESSEHGQTVSETARTTEAEGADKGAEVSGLASEGRSGAGADETAEDTPDTPQPAPADGASDAGRDAAEDRDAAPETRGGDGHP